jgi:uncharacterized protein (DUF302 family)
VRICDWHSIPFEHRKKITTGIVQKEILTVCTENDSENVLHRTYKELYIELYIYVGVYKDMSYVRLLNYQSRFELIKYIYALFQDIYIYVYTFYFYRHLFSH